MHFSFLFGCSKWEDFRKVYLANSVPNPGHPSRFQSIPSFLFETSGLTARKLLVCKNVCSNVCVYIYMYIHIKTREWCHVCVHVCICVYSFTGPCTYVKISICAFVGVYTYIYMSKRIIMYICTPVNGSLIKNMYDRPLWYCFASALTQCVQDFQNR